ncbi:MAG: T9SS type A sorting domain-containing protein [Bacteroidia bacterium]
MTATWPPTLGTNFFGNTYGGGDPADNALAISAGGKIICGSNTRFHTYDETGTQTSAKNFTQFASAGGVNTFFTFDPKCLYDPIEDRFIVAFLNGSAPPITPNSSKVIVAFSQTNDPAGSWNVYALNGNVNNLGVWTDFVQIGLNTNELFVTGNPFTQQGSSEGAAIWQINKAEGYNGTALNPVVYHLSGAFSVHPVQGGSTSYGPQMYFVESELGSSASIKLHQITNSIANGGVLNSAVGFTLDISYAIPPDADQQGTTSNLKTNDTRIQSSYYENGSIEFVLNTAVNGRAGILHGTGIISSFAISFSSFTARLLGIPDLDIAYPSIAYAGQQDLSGFNHSYLAFNTTGAANFPGCAAVYVDEAGFSPHTVIREGVNWINSGDDRWGDYADVCERTGHPGEVWAVGTIGNSSLQQRTYIGQLLPPVPVAVQPEIERATMEVYPNPTTEIVKFTFPVEEAGEYAVRIYDLQGREIRLLVQNWLVPGKAMTSFNAAYLPAGTYVVKVAGMGKELFAEKFVVE